MFSAFDCSSVQTWCHLLIDKSYLRSSYDTGDQTTPECLVLIDPSRKWHHTLIWFESTEVTTTGQEGISRWADCMIIWVIWGLTSCFLSTVMLFHTQRRREPIRCPDYLVASVSVLERSKFNLPDLQRESQSCTDFCQTSSISRHPLKFAGFRESTETSAHRGEVRGRRGNRWAQTENNKRMTPNTANMKHGVTAHNFWIGTWSFPMFCRIGPLRCD